MKVAVAAVDGLLAALLIVSVVMAVRASGSRSAVQRDPRRNWAAVCASLGACLSITVWLLRAPALAAIPTQLLSVALFIVTAVLLRHVVTEATTRK